MHKNLVGLLSGITEQPLPESGKPLQRRQKGELPSQPGSGCLDDTVTLREDAVTQKPSYKSHLRFPQAQTPDMLDIVTDYRYRALMEH